MGINFNHISHDLSEEDVKIIKSNYHKKAICFKWQYKNLKKQRLFLNMISIGLTASGTIAGIVTLNPIVLGVLSGIGVGIQGYITNKKVEN